MPTLLPSDYIEKSAMLMDRRHFLAAMQNIVDKRCAARRETPPVTDPKSVGVISIYGYLMLNVPQEYKDFGFDATGYADIAAQAKAYMEDPTCSSVVLSVDSGGGNVWGVDVAERALSDLASKKPVRAIVGKVCASAAYWLASQATTIEASPMSQVGGIGVYGTIYDTSEMMKQMGIKPVVIRSAPHKGMGEDEITPEQIAAEQSVVDGIHAMFVDTVAKGRGISKELAKAVATGQTYIADEAMKLCLIDSITNAPTAGAPLSPTMEGKTMMTPKAETAETVVEPLTPDTANPPAPEGEGGEPDPETPPADDPVQQAYQHAADIVATFGSNPVFCADALKRRLTITEAKAEYCDVLMKAQPAPVAAGAKPVRTSPAEGRAAGTGEAAKAFYEEAKKTMSLEKAVYATEAKFPGFLRG